MKNAFPLRSLAVLALMLCSGCGKAQMSDARMSHLLAADHGWIDLVVKAPPARDATGSARECAIRFASNGEVLLQEGADFAAASQGGTPIGYRFPVPAGQLNVELSFSRCLKNDALLKQAVPVGKNQLVELTVDGSELKLGAASPYLPASLDEVRGQIGALQSGVRDAEARELSLKTLVLGSLGLNAAAVALLLWRRRRGG